MYLTINFEVSNFLLIIIILEMMMIIIKISFMASNLHVIYVAHVIDATERMNCLHVIDVIKQLNCRVIDVIKHVN